MQTPREAARERQLFEAFIGGDDAAFEVLFHRYYTRLVRDASRYVPADIAEDLVQDLFTWLWLNRTRWTVRTTVRNYLHGAVRNRARDLTARFQSEQRTTETLQRTLSPPYDRSPEDHLLLQELEETIERGLASCAPRSRAALLLVEEHPRYADIARQLGIRPGTVQVLIKRARRRLRAYLRAEGWDDAVSSLHRVNRRVSDQQPDTELDLAV